MEVFLGLVYLWGLIGYLCFLTKFYGMEKSSNVTQMLLIILGGLLSVVGLYLYIKELENEYDPYDQGFENFYGIPGSAGKDVTRPTNSDHTAEESDSNEPRLY